MYCSQFWIVFHTCFAFKFCISSFFDTIWFLKNISLLMFFPSVFLSSVSPFSFFFSFSIFVSSLLEFFHLNQFLVQFSKKKVFQSLFFFHLSLPFILFSPLFAFICFNISFSIWSLFFSVSFFFGFFFLKNFSFLTFFAHMFLSSLSFFLSIVFPFPFSPFFLYHLFPYLLFFVSSFTFILRKKWFHSLLLSWCRSLFPPLQQMMESPRERCEESDCMCSENCIVWTSTWG